MYLVDTNIFLEVLLSQKRKDECESFLTQVKNGKKIGIVTDFTIHSIIVIMGSLNRLNELKTFLTSLTAYKGLKIYSATLTDEVNAAEIALNQQLDMDDSIQYSIAIALNVEAIISFDKHFDNLKIARKEPKTLENKE
jgi:predicted nucleic acid-binding protein